VDATQRQRQANAQSGNRAQPGQEAQQSAQEDASSNPQSDRSGRAQQGGSPRDGTPPQGSESQRGLAQANDRQGEQQGRGGNPRGDPQDRPGDGQANRPGREGDRLTLDANGGPESPDGWGGTGPRGPFTDENYGPWSDRLRDVQEMLPEQDLRERMARIWDSVRSIRAESKRHGQEPQWDLVQNQVINPLVELRQRVSERLAQLQSDQAMVPIDRDPVPDRFSELVRTYFENLGQGEL
jgi:hypothetical protein